MNLAVSYRSGLVADPESESRESAKGNDVEDAFISIFQLNHGFCLGGLSGTEGLGCEV